MGFCFRCGEAINQDRKMFCSNKCLIRHNECYNTALFESKDLSYRIIKCMVDVKDLDKSLKRIVRMRELNKTFKRTIETIPFEFGNLLSKLDCSTLLYHKRTMENFVETCFKNDLVRNVYFGIILFRTICSEHKVVIDTYTIVNTEFMRSKIAPLLHENRPSWFFEGSRRDVYFWSLKNSILPFPVSFKLTRDKDIKVASRICVIENGDADVCEEWLKIQENEDDIFWIITFCFSVESEELLRELLVTRKIPYPWQKRLMTESELAEFMQKGGGLRYGQVDMFRILLESGMKSENLHLMFEHSSLEMYYCCSNHNYELLDFIKDELKIPVHPRFYNYNIKDEYVRNYPFPF